MTIHQTSSHLSINSSLPKSYQLQSKYLIKQQKNVSIVTRTGVSVSITYETWLFLKLNLNTPKIDMIQQRHSVGLPLPNAYMYNKSLHQLKFSQISQSQLSKTIYSLGGKTFPKTNNKSKCHLISNHIL